MLPKWNQTLIDVASYTPQEKHFNEPELYRCHLRYHTRLFKRLPASAERSRRVWDVNSQVGGSSLPAAFLLDLLHITSWTSLIERFPLQCHKPYPNLMPIGEAGLYALPYRLCFQLWIFYKRMLVCTPIQRCCCHTPKIRNTQVRACLNLVGALGNIC